MYGCLFLLWICVGAVLLQRCESFVPKLASLAVAAASSTRQSTLVLEMACRRNNKLEKREKNKLYARKYQSKEVVARQDAILKQQRMALIDNEEQHSLKLFEHTTDADYPAFVFETT